MEGGKEVAWNHPGAIFAAKDLLVVAFLHLLLKHCTAKAAAGFQMIGGGLPKLFLAQSMKNLPNILAEARACTACAGSLPLGPKPLLAADPASRILLIGQAPGKATHEAGIPWKDRSGDRLREWLGVSTEQFYNPKQMALVPTGFCYPGSGTKGDLPPRAECAPLWHPRILPLLTHVKLTIFLGSFAFSTNLGERYRNLSEAAEDFRNLLPETIVLPHPSPRAGMWISQRPWFSSELLPELQRHVKQVLSR